MLHLEEAKFTINFKECKVAKVTYLPYITFIVNVHYKVEILDESKRELFYYLITITILIGYSFFKLHISPSKTH